ncbi:MAG: TetR/AcrR family transcriptional regulator [Acutalibacteraceae bacterium]|nr:TetR/AcrR family transcriptional regulator [Acutalibacteraceae bacterium]
MGRERQTQKNEATRKAIIETAISIGLDEGFDELSIRKITDRLGYSSGIVYHYFKDKQEILDTIHNQTSMELKETIDMCIKEGRSFTENTELVFKMLSEISIHQPDIFKLILLNRYSHKSYSTEIWLDMIKRCIEMGIKSGELRNIDVETASYIMLNSFLVAQMIINEKEGIEKNKIEHIFETELDIILNGLLNKKD